MCPRITKAESRGSFLGGKFGRGFDDRAERITELVGIFAVGVVDAPLLAGGFQSRVRAHGDSSAQPASTNVYQLHKMRRQSRSCPRSGYDDDAMPLKTVSEV